MRHLRHFEGTGIICDIFLNLIVDQIRTALDIRKNLGHPPDDQVLNFSHPWEFLVIRAFFSNCLHQCSR